MDRRQSGPLNQMDEQKKQKKNQHQIPCSNIFHVTAKLTIPAQHNVVDVDSMVLNVLMFVHAQIVKSQ